MNIKYYTRLPVEVRKGERSAREGIKIDAKGVINDYFTLLGARF